MGPFIKDKNTTKKMMNHLLISLLPIIAFAIVKNGMVPYKRGYTDIIGLFYPILLISISIICTVAFEKIFNLIAKNKKENFKISYSIFTGIFLALILPINTPIWLLILGILISVIITNILSIVFGKNILNPAIIACLFITIIFGTTIANNGGYVNKYELNTLSSTTPLANSINIDGIGNYDTLVKPFKGLSKIFLGTVPGTLGDTSILLCVIALIYLIYFKIIKWRIPATYMLTVFAMTYVIGGSNNLGIWYPIFQLSTGGLIFSAVFLASDTLTSPTTPIGQILYGIFLGILTIIFRYLFPLEQGIILSILIMDLFVIVLDKIGSLARFNFKIALPPFIISWILILGLSLGISMKYDNNNTQSEQNQIEIKQ